MEYFIYQGDQSHGPLSFEDLKQKNIIASTPIWKEGLAGWVHASTIHELKELFAKQPPAFQTIHTSPPHYTLGPDYSSSASVTEKIGYSIGKSIRTIIILIVVAFGVYFLYGQLNTGRTSSYSLPPIIEDPEHARPEQYLSASGTYRTNFWGNKFVLNGRVTNNAAHTNYKDIRVKVSFLSPTKTVLSTQEYVIYDYVPYGSTKDFTLKLDRPAVASACSFAAVTATYY
jgi:hypothetical protein